MVLFKVQPKVFVGAFDVFKTYLTRRSFDCRLGLQIFTVPTFPKPLKTFEIIGGITWVDVNLSVVSKDNEVVMKVGCGAQTGVESGSDRLSALIWNNF